MKFGPNFQHFQRFWDGIWEFLGKIWIFSFFFSPYFFVRFARFWPNKLFWCVFYLLWGVWDARNVFFREKVRPRKKPPKMTKFQENPDFGPNFGPLTKAFSGPWKWTDFSVEPFFFLYPGSTQKWAQYMKKHFWRRFGTKKTQTKNCKKKSTFFGKSQLGEKIP